MNTPQALLTTYSKLFKCLSTVLILNSKQEVYNDLEQILPNLNIEHQISQKIIIMGIQNATISVELIATVMLIY